MLFQEVLNFLLLIESFVVEKVIIPLWRNALSTNVRYERLAMSNILEKGLKESVAHRGRFVVKLACYEIHTHGVKHTGWSWREDELGFLVGLLELSLKQMFAFTTYQVNSKIRVHNLLGLAFRKK